MFRTNGRTDPLSGAIRKAASPVAVAFTDAANWTGDFAYGLLYARRLTAENRAMHDQVVAAALYSEQTDLLMKEIESLRKLQALPDLPGHVRVNADIIGFFPNENRITLSAGTNKGIERGQPVVCADGLIGVVETVDPTQCQALLITTLDEKRKFGAMDISRNPPAEGIARGIGPSTLELTLYNPKAPVQIGDTVTTLGAGEKIPRNLVVGKIIQVDDNENTGTRTAKVDWSVSMGLVKEVQILR